MNFCIKYLINVVLIFTIPFIFNGCKKKSSELKEWALDRTVQWVKIKQVPLFIPLSDIPPINTNTNTVNADKSDNNALKSNGKGKFDHISKKIENYHPVFLPYIKDQFKYTLFDLRLHDGALGIERIKLIKAEVVGDKPVSIKGTTPFIEIKYDIAIPLVYYESSIDFANLELLIPLRTDKNYKLQILNRFNHCGKADAFADNFFYHFDKRTCNFKELNQNNEFFTPVNLLIPQKNTDASKGGCPEYDRIWEDNKMVVIFIFGFYDDHGSNDKGVLQYQLFKSLLSEYIYLEEVSKYKTNSTHSYYLFNLPMEENSNQKRQVEIDVLNLSMSDIDPARTALLRKILGDKISKTDIMMYSGHSDYGIAIENLEKIIQPTNCQYTLFFLNGCSTYSYSYMINPNFDVIYNGEMSDFDDFGATTMSFLTNLLNGDCYKQILSEISENQEPIVVNEDVASNKCK